MASATVNAGVGAACTWAFDNALSGLGGSGLGEPRAVVDGAMPDVAGHRVISMEQTLQQNAASVGARDLGEAFSGIYSPSTGKLVAEVSGEVPPALMVRNGGHNMINKEVFGCADDTVAFTAIITEDGPRVTWKPMGVNAMNHGEREAPNEYRQPILDLLEGSTGMGVRG
ncbi:hypothetical protein [Streptomyces sp. NPDC050538]|uniref:hypothetical protein n=1 Tax=Streptomyces sp. NPDC050538 TaxID=3365627 RepID=UPI00379A5713